MKKEDASRPALESDPTAGPPPAETLGDAQEHPEVLTIVGIGASAGGLDALQKLLPGLPAGVGMAYVIVQHLAPQHISTLPDLLARHTDLSIVTIANGLQMAADTIYITPPNTDVVLIEDRLVLRKGADIGPKPSIDVFFRSLAEAKQAHAVGIILSGTGTDGAHGIRAIKSHEGITMAQMVISAKFDGMPRAAIETGLVDLVLPPEKIGPELRIALAYPHLISKVPVKRGADEIGTILARLHEVLGVDFSDYKRNTIHRRISRRMAIHKIDELKHYIALIDNQPEELTALYKDMLISVTGFFRDGPAFEALAAALRRLMAGKQRGDTFRAWVPGCATGEEAYSIAMLMADIMGEDLCKYRYQIFATDLDEDSVQLARKAVYPVATVMETDGRRFEKFFVPGNNAIAVSKQIRDMVILARHDLIKDTNFMHLDLISCRNLLIYINPDLQDKLLSLFHFSLDPDGLLFLGKSESVGQRLDLFKALDMKWKIFQRRETPSRRLPELMQTRQVTQMRGFRTIMESQQDSCAWREGDFFDSLLEMMDCCAVLIDAKATIHYIRGDVNPYFKFPVGSVRDNLNAIELALPELRHTLQSMLHKVSREAQTITSKSINFDDDQRAVRIKVGSAPRKDLEGYRIIVFTPVEPSRITTRHDAAPDTAEHAHIHELEEELQFTREHLQATVEELETSTEELQSLNEELQSSNEELQATNEELETSNEELQASNEELNTVNDELRAKSEEATHLLDSLTQNEKRYRGLVDNMNEALMLCEIEYGADRRPTDLVIRKANRSLKALLGIRTRDLPLRAGAMPLPELIAAEMLARFEAIAKGGSPQHFEVHLATLAKDLFLSVYPVDEGRLGMVCRDDTERQRVDTALRASEAQYRTVGEAIPYGVWITDTEGFCTYVSPSFLEMTGMTMAQVQELGWMHLLPPEDVEPTQTHWMTCVRTGEPFSREHRFRAADGTFRHVLALGRPVRDDTGHIVSWVGLNLDITERKKAEEAIRRSNQELEQFAYAASHDLQEPLRSMVGFLQLLEQDYGDRVDAAGQHYIERAVAAGHRMQRMIRDLLALSQATTSRGRVAATDLNQLIRRVLAELEPALQAKKVRVTCSDLPTLNVDANQIARVFQNLVLNAVKYNQSLQPEIVIEGREEPDGYHFQVRDNGIGIEPRFHERIFKVFQRLHTESEYEGTGLGLALCKKTVERHGGTIWVSSQLNEGATFHFTLPREGGFA